MDEKIRHIRARINYLKERRRKLESELPDLEARRDWADKNEAASIWYHANVAVNQAKREIRRIDRELAEQRSSLDTLQMRKRWQE